MPKLCTKSGQKRAECADGSKALPHSLLVVVERLTLLLTQNLHLRGEMLLLILVRLSHRFEPSFWIFVV